MTETFFERLTARARTVDSLLCVGLDPRAESLDELRHQCGRLIDATLNYAAAYKPNSAFFEAWGPEGTLALLDVIADIPDEIPVLLDAKRGDIGETSAAYARAVFDTLGAQGVTVHPYTGRDGLAPFLARREAGIFVLCKTSNPGADELQALVVAEGGGRRPLFELVAEAAQRWNELGNVGLVVGATDPAAMARIRALAPHMWFLVPGVGAQGGNLASLMRAGLRADGLGLLINVSRSLANAPSPAAEAQRMVEAMRGLRAEVLASRETADGEPRTPVGDQRSAVGGRPSTGFGDLAALAQALLEAGCVKFGAFMLKSGAVSPIYLDLRLLVSHPRALRLAAQAYAGVLGRLEFDRIAGIPYAALPIATAIGLAMDRPVVYPRREAKEYGTKAAVEGAYQAGETVVVVDDLATTGGSKLEAIEKLTAAGLTVRDVVVLIDRGQGAAEALAQAGYRLHAVTTLLALLDEWQRAGAVSEAQYRDVMTFLKRSEA
jgi:uridine monophosphate synthetase